MSVCLSMIFIQMSDGCIRCGLSQSVTHSNICTLDKFVQVEEKHYVISIQFVPFREYKNVKWNFYLFAHNKDSGESGSKKLLTMTFDADICQQMYSSLSDWKYAKKQLLHSVILAVIMSPDGGISMFERELSSSGNIRQLIQSSLTLSTKNCQDVKRVDKNVTNGW